MKEELRKERGTARREADAGIGSLLSLIYTGKQDQRQRKWQEISDQLPQIKSILDEVQIKVSGSRNFYHEQC